MGDAAEALENAFDGAQGSGSPTSAANDRASSQVTAQLAGSLTTLASTIDKLSSKIDSLERPASGDHPTPTLTTSSRLHDVESSLRSKRKRVDQHQDHAALTPFSFTNPSAPISRCGYTQLPAELLDDVVQLYFMHVHNWIPILHWTRFKHKYRHGAAGDKMGVILNALVVGTLKYVDRERYQLSDSDVRRISTEAREKVLLTAMDSLCVENLQALIILAFLDVSYRHATHEATAQAVSTNH